MREVIYQKERIENQIQAWYNVENKFPMFSYQGDYSCQVIPSGLL
jgi:hypothetical protein